MTNNESITPHTTTRLICDMARKHSLTVNADGSPSWAYQVGYLSTVVKQLLDRLPEEQLRAVHEEFQRRAK